MRLVSSYPSHSSLLLPNSTNTTSLPAPPRSTACASTRTKSTPASIVPAVLQSSNGMQIVVMLEVGREETPEDIDCRRRWSGCGEGSMLTETSLWRYGCCWKAMPESRSKCTESGILVCWRVGRPLRVLAFLVGSGVTDTRRACLIGSLLRVGSML